MHLRSAAGGRCKNRLTANESGRPARGLRGNLLATELRMGTSTDPTCGLHATHTSQQEHNTCAHLHRHVLESPIFMAYQNHCPNPDREGEGEGPAALGPRQGAAPSLHPITSPAPFFPSSKLPLAFGKLHHLLKDHPSFTGVGRDCYGSFCHHGNRCGLKGLRALIRLLGWEVIRTADQGDLYGAVREAPHQTSSLCLWGISRRGCM